jgi:RNA polymerase sigma-70 factor (ECF subfamily)
VDTEERRTLRLAARMSHDDGEEALTNPALVVSERQRLVQALRRLPEPEREALRLVGWDGLDLAGAALAMGCSRLAMAMRLHRARRRLESELRRIDDASAIETSERQLSTPAQRVVQHESRRARETA